MPVFHTKTIESILDPVAQQVSRLVILHEEAEDGNAMPDLERPVLAVSQAVANLAKVGRETINSSDDPILKQDMPVALARVEQASKLLEGASSLIKADPFSVPARKKLIEGSRGILQGTSALLLCFDESEVRKIIRECKKVLDYLAVAEVIESMEDLVQFVKDLSPCLSKVSREVDAREKELTHQIHREILIRCLEQVKNLAPILICSMKIFIQIIAQGGKGAEEAAENRNYLSQRMTDEINEIIRVLQLTTYDEDEWDADNLTVMKKAQNAIEGKLQAAHDWLQDHVALRGGVGERSVRQILDHARKVSERCLPPDRVAVSKMCGDLHSMTDALCELRQDGKGTTPQGVSLSRGVEQKLNELSQYVHRAVTNVEKSGIQQPAHTVSGRLEQARRWLVSPSVDDRGLGRQAIGLIVEEGRKVADGLPGVQKADLLSLSDEVHSLSEQLYDLCCRGQGNSTQAQAITRSLSQKLHQLKNQIQSALVNRVVEDFIDIASPLKQFTDAVHAPEGTPGRDSNFNDKAQGLTQFSTRAAKTARMVAAGGSSGNKKLAEALLTAACQVESLTPQLVNAGRIRMTYPSNQAASEHFQNLQRQYADSVQQMRNLCDEATDSATFIKQSEEQMKRHTIMCEDGIRNQQPQRMVDSTSSIARLSNRVLMVAKQESDNSEDPQFIAQINRAADKLQNSVTPMVQSAKAVAMNVNDHTAVNRWRDYNKELIHNVAKVREAVTVTRDDDAPELPPPPDMNALHLNESNQAPPRKSPSSPPANYKFFTEKVGPSLRQQLSPRTSYYSPSHSPVPSTGSKISPSGGSVSPIPKYGRGNTSDLLQEECTSEDDKSPYYSVYRNGSGCLERDAAPPRPPPPMSGDFAPPRPPPPETDDEDDMFLHAPQPNQPIMLAAHGLHQEVRQWSSRDNEIIAAAKKMAKLMGHLSQLVRGEGGTKKDLISCAKAIAESSEEVARLAKELARQCTDKRMRTNLLQVCERIPTIGTQLKILSTVKATMLGAQETIPRSADGEIHGGSEEDQEATEMLVGNAQNLMQSVKETVRAAEAASIKIRTDAGIRLRWIRRQPWYQY